MDKVLLTAYRKLYKMSSIVDQSTGMRSILSCAPQVTYTPRRGEWVPINIAKLSQWPESRIFLDNLIRRLNNGRTFYLPATTETERAAAEEAMRALRAEQAMAGATASDESAAAIAAAAVAAGVAAGGGEAAATAEVTTATATPTTDADSTTTAERFSTDKDTAGSSGEQRTAHASPTATAVPATVLPYSSLRATLRQLFESTAFSLGNLNNAFAAVKELSYACEVTRRHQPLLVGLPEELRALPWPRLTRVLAVDKVHRVHLIKGLTEEVLESLRMSSSSSSRGRKARAARKPEGDGAESEAEPKNAFDDPEGAARTATAKDSDPEAASFDEDVSVGGVLGEVGVADGADTAADVTSAAIAAQSAATPEHIQLLLSHPQLHGFFRHSVLLVVRNAENEAAAFIINKPLENDEGMRMPVNSTIRLNRVHPLFGRHLRDHTVMVGGPVMVGGAFDESVFLLHSIPEVPSALPLGDGLWLDGDMDNITARIDAGEAAASDVVVVCGFSGWGYDQLRGEVESGTWLVASGDAADRAVPSFVMQLAHESGAHSAPMDVEAVAAGEASVEASAEQQAEAAEPARLSVRISASRRATASWVWAYDVLGEPLASLATNQKPEPGSEFSE